MKNSKILLTVLTVSLSTAALAAPIIDFNTTSAPKSGTPYSGSFEYGGNVYGPKPGATFPAVAGTSGGVSITAPTNSTINLSTAAGFPTFTVVGTPTLDTVNPAHSLSKRTISSYKLYKQDYSYFVGNTSRLIEAPFGFVNNDPSFTMDYGGDSYGTVAENHLVSLGSYTYNGPLFTPASIGTFTYTITASPTGNLTGSGTAVSSPTTFSLNSTDVKVNAAGDLGVTAGSVTITPPLPDPNIIKSTALKYDLTVFGNKGQEVVGKIYGLHPNNSTGEVNDYGFAGK